MHIIAQNTNKKSNQISQLTNSIEHHLTRRIGNHGVAIARVFGCTWTKNSSKMNIPIVWGGVQRGRIRDFAPTQKRYKSMWDNQRGAATPRYFAYPDLAQHIRDNNGTLHFAAGEMDVFAFAAAGIKSVMSSAHGETSIPRDMGDDLKALGVRHVVYWPDNDEAGQRAGRLVHDACEDAGITCTIYDTSSLVEQGGDVNDIWQLAGFDTPRFKRLLYGCTLLTLPPSPKKKPTIQRTYSGDDFPADFVAAVIREIEKQPNAKQRGDNILCSSPFREDRKPSFSFNIKKLVAKDFATGEGWGVIALGNALGIDISDYRDPPPTPPAAPAALPDPIDDGQPFTNDFDPYYVDSIDLGPVAQKVGQGGVRQFTPDMTINKRYLSAEDIPGAKTVLIQSPMGSAKTTAYMDYIKQNQPKRVLIVTHRVALIENILKRLEAAGLHQFESYQSYLSMGLPVGALDKMVISFDSLHMLKGAAAYDLIIIDEITQGYDHLYAKRGTMSDSKNRAAHQEINAILKNAGQVIGLDAGMTDTISDWMRRIRGNCTNLQNTYQPNRGKMTLVSTPAVAFQRAMDAVEPGGLPVVFVTNSRRESALYYAAAREIYPSAEVMLVNADTGDAKRDLLTDPDVILSGVDILITSPSIGTGVDIQKRVAGVFGAFFNEPTIAGDNMQQIMRFRNADQRVIYHVASESDEFPTDPEAIRDDYIKTAMTTADKAGFSQHKLKTFDAVDLDMLTEHAHAQAARNRQKANTLQAFISIATAEGFTVTLDGDSTADAMKGILSETRKAIEEAKDAKRLTVDPIPRDQWRQHSIAGTITLDIRLGYERWKIEDLLGATITDELNTDYKSAANRAAFRRFLDLGLSRADLAQKDRAEAGKLLYRRNHNIAHVDLFNGLLAVAFPDGGLLSDERVGRSELKRRVAPFIEAHADAIRRLDGRNDLSQDPVKVALRILKRFHIGVGYSRERVKDANGRVLHDADGRDIREQVYWIDQDRLAVIQARAEVARKQRAENAENTLDIRDFGAFMADDPPDTQKTPWVPPEAHKMSLAEMQSVEF